MASLQIRLRGTASLNKLACANTSTDVLAELRTRSGTWTLGHPFYCPSALSVHMIPQAHCLGFPMTEQQNWNEDAIMNTASSALRALNDQELDQVSGGLSAFGYYVDVDLVNYGDGEKVHVSWGEEGGSYNYVEVNVGC